MRNFASMTAGVKLTPRHLLLAAGSIILAATGIVVWGIFHTLDWTDESWALSLIANNRVSVGEPWAFQYLVHPIFALFGSSIISLRIVRLVAFIALGILAGWVMIRIARSKGYELSKTMTGFVFIAAQIGTLLAWSWPPRYFAYNELSSIGVQSVALLVALLLFSNERTSKRVLGRWTAWTLWFVAGLIVGLLFYAKFTGFIALVPVVIIGSALYRGRIRVGSPILAITGILVGVAGPAVAGLPLGDYLSSVLANIFDESVRVANVHPSGLVGMYINNLWGAFQVMAPVGLFIVAILVVSSGVIGNGPDSREMLARVTLLGVFVLLVLAAGYTVLASSGAERTGRLAMIMAVTAASVALFFAWSPTQRMLGIIDNAASIRTWSAVALLAVAPILVSVGTNNPLTIHFGFGATVWAAAFGITLVLWFDFLTKRGTVSISLLPLTAIVALAAMAAIGVVRDGQAPYRSASFRANNTPIGITGPLGGLWVTPGEAAWAQWLQSESKRLNAVHVPTLSVKSAGALVAFNNSDFASPWLESFWPASYWSIGEACEGAVVRDLIIIQPGSAPVDGPDIGMMADELSASCAITFPQDFAVVSTYDSENVSQQTTIWRLRG